MTQILNGKTLALELQKELIKKNQLIFGKQKKYIAIIFLGDDKASATYVKYKKNYGVKIGMHVEVFGQLDDKQTDFHEDLNIYKNQDYDSINKVIELIKYLNYDNDCVGILVQLPLPDELKNYQSYILSSISPKKDIDGLGGVLQGMSSIDLLDFIPATPKSVLYLLNKYELDNFQGKTVSILGQSNLVGKPLTIELIKKGASVYSTNHYNSQDKIKEITQKSDYIISCTGSIHLIDETYLNPNGNQIIIDVGYGYKDGKPVGDVQIDKIKDKVKAYTPVPGGIGPLTVACLFDNVFVLQEYKQALKDIL